MNKILVGYENDIIDLAAGTGFGLGLNTTNNSEFESFLDRIFHQNNSDAPITYNGTAWTKEYVGRCMTSKYLKLWHSALYLGNCQFTGSQIPQKDGSNITFPSRVFKSDLFLGNTLTWGIEWGRNGATTSGTRIFQVTTTGGTLIQDFVASNIKVGDPLFITSGNTQLASEKPYIVTRVDSAYRLIVDRNFPVTATSLHFWVGSNWFDVGSDDNDQITGFGENSDRLLIYKLLSFNFYTGSQNKKVSGAIGTSSSRSIINDSYGNTYYFHGSDPKKSGIYKYNGVGSVKVSRAIDPFIAGMSATNYTGVVSWEEEGNKLRFFLGDLTNTNYNISMTKAVATLNVDTNTWSVDPIADTITCAATFRTSNQQDTYCGTADSQVLKMNTGYNFNGTPIGSTLETKVYYPSGTEIVNEYPYLQVIGRSTKGTKIKYKLWDNPTGVDQEWWPLGELTDDKTELIIPSRHNQSSGIQLKFEELGSLENDTYIEKVSFFYKPNRMRLM